MFFDQPLMTLVRQATARPDMLWALYAALLAETERRDATLQSSCGIRRLWLAGELDRLDALSASGQTAGLFGVPVGIKDTIVVSGLPTKAGTPVDVGRLLRLEQSPVVTRLQEAGAIVVAKQATHQFCSSAGPATTQSPRGKEFFAGGSTVGGAVAVAAGLTRLAVGSDAAGSIRHPAALAGIAGLRPRKGVLSDEGQVNGALSGQSTGLLARSAADIATVLAQCPSLFTAPSDRPVTDRAHLTIAIPEITWINIDPAAAAALRLAAARLAAAGHKVVPTTLWLTEDALADFFLIMNFENWLFHRPLMERHPGIYHPDVYKVMRTGEMIDPGTAAVARLRLADHQRRFLEQAHAEGLDMLLTPSVPWPDIRKDAGAPRALSAEGGRFTVLSNIYDLDSLSVPTEQGPEGWTRSVMLQGLTVPLSRLLASAEIAELSRSGPPA
ncbi:amidase family protein (plasmid) [Ensifer adhaerens]|uniref:amidase family protein n=1 Tax=Ensifer adhaerens TaxID=106592 RepID=UPI0023A97D93|nr:amidase family protein [Ensifer adhaerens]WDZ81465.1 amidase family protein [Ensifer adhaerens]